MRSKCPLFLLPLLTLMLGCPDSSDAPENPRGMQKRGTGCLSDQECETGLKCNEQGACVFELCTQASDPDAWCRQKISGAGEKAVCDVSLQQCVVQRSGRGESCQEDETCIQGLVCEQSTCVETCRSSASCRVAGEVCAERQNGKQGVRVCQPDPGCEVASDPLVQCADRLGLTTALVACVENRCQAKVLKSGELCRFDIQCGELAVCHESRCAELCEKEGAACPMEEACLPRPLVPSQRLCQEAQCGAFEEPDLYCQDNFGPNGRCNASTGQCEEVRTCEPWPECDMTMPEAKTYRWITILDGTAGDAACTESAEWPGTEFHMVVGFGKKQQVLTGVVGAFEPQEPFVPSTGATEWLASEGSIRINLNTGCPEDSEWTKEQSLSLGCGGQVTLDFRQEEDEALELKSGDQVVLAEQQAICEGNAGGAEEATESFAIQACNDSRSQCALITPQQLGDGLWSVVLP